MIKRVIQLLKIARKLNTSGALETINQIYKIPLTLKVFFDIISFGSSKRQMNNSKSSGQKLCDALEGMGTTFIKLGQFLATRPDIIGNQLAVDLEKLQDKLPAFDTKISKEILKKEIGLKQYENIIDLSKPIAAASIAQVHLAKINEKGEEKEVAIKILRPDIERIFNEELDALMLFAYIVEGTVKKTKRLKLVEVVHLLREITNIEMDLRFEAAAANEIYENTKNDNGFNIPKIYWQYTSKKVLTLDRVRGVSIRDHDSLKRKNIDLKNIATNLIQHFLRQAVRDGFFHADMHEGNLFVDDNGNIVPVDFGIMGRLDKSNKKYLAEILYGFIKRDYVKVAEVHFQAGLVPETASKEEFAQALRSVGEPIFGQNIKDISGGNLLSQLFEITEKFNMATQTQLLLLQKTMVVVEGVARRLNPETNIWETSRPVLEKWLKETKDPITTLNETLKNSAEVIKKLPEMPQIMDKANQALTFLASGQIPQNTNTYNDLNTKKSEMVAFRNQSIIGLLLLVILGLVVF